MTKNTSLEYVTCDFCASGQWKIIGRFKSDDLAQINKSLRKDKKIPIGPANSKLQVVRCTTCSLQYINPRLSSHELKRVYEGFYAKRFYGETVSFEKSVYNFLNTDQEKGRLKEIERFKIGGKILDIGAGPGHFLKIAKDAGWQVFGQDLSSKASKIAKTQFGIHIFAGKLEKLPYPNNFFDVITMHSTIEHCTNPSAYIEIVSQKLKKDGLFVFSAPNLRSVNYFLAKILRIPYPGFIFEHLYYFNPTIISRMLKERFTIMEMTSFHHSRPIYPITQEKPNNTKPKNKLSIFFQELIDTKQKINYIRRRFYFFQMRILREFLEYNTLVGKLKLGDVLYVFAQKKNTS